MRKTFVLLTLLLSTPALAWVPQLDETTAKTVIDGAYGRRAPVATFRTVDLSVKDGQFAAGKNVVKAFEGGPNCVQDWLASPQDFSAGSRPLGLTLSGQADQLFFQAQDARDSFKNLSAKEALGEAYAGKRLANGELRIDVSVRGLPSEQARSAYLVRLKGKGGQLLAPARSTYVNDWKPMNTADAATTPVSATAASTTDGKTTTTNATATASPAKGPFEGTLVYYFEPLKAGLGASDKVELLLRTEADTDCAYSVTLDLGSFQ